MGWPWTSPGWARALAPALHMGGGTTNRPQQVAASGSPQPPPQGAPQATTYEQLLPSAAASGSPQPPLPSAAAGARPSGGGRGGRSRLSHPRAPSGAVCASPTHAWGPTGGWAGGYRRGGSVATAQRSVGPENIHLDLNISHCGSSGSTRAVGMEEEGGSHINHPRVNPRTAEPA